mgnify:CR=1 FL=1
MATIRLKLRTDNIDSSGRASIAIVYQNGRKESFLATGKKCLPSEFNKNNPLEPLDCKTNPENKIHNMTIRAKVAKLTQLVDGYFLTNNEYPSNDIVKNWHNGKTNITSDTFSLFDEYIRYKSSKGVKTVCDGTIRNYEKVKRKMLEFDKSISIDKMDKTYAEKYSHWLITKHNYLSNSVGEHLKVIASFLRYAKENGFQICDLKAFKGTNDKSWATYLTFDEVKRLASFPTDLMYIRDAFVLQCCLGVRHSDLKTIIQSKIIKDGSDWYYVANTKKTNKLIRVKLIDIAREIMDKNGCTDWIPKIGEFNLGLKTLFEQFGFNEKITLSKGSGISRREIEKPKFMLISSHTARRTSINLFRKLKVDDATISSITGQSLSVLRGYYQPSQSDTNEAMELLNESLK